MEPVCFVQLRLLAQTWTPTTVRPWPVYFSPLSAETETAGKQHCRFGWSPESLGGIRQNIANSLRFSVFTLQLWTKSHHAASSHRSKVWTRAKAAGQPGQCAQFQVLSRCRPGGILATSQSLGSD